MDTPEPTAQEIDDRAKITSALRADTQLHAGLSRRVDEQERKIVNTMVADYRRHELTVEKLWGFVGQIVGVRDLLSSVTTDMKVAEAALKSEED
jgi:hypothetical protein